MGRTVPGSGLPDRLRDNGGMLAIVFALASAISYGGSDFAAGLAARSVSVIQVTLVASVASLVVVAAAVPFAAAHPPQAPHCLENTGPEPLRVLGVFHPAGSPAAKREG